MQREVCFAQVLVDKFLCSKAPIPCMVGVPYRALHCMQAKAKPSVLMLLLSLKLLPAPPV